MIILARSRYSTVFKLDDQVCKNTDRIVDTLREISLLKAIDHPSIIKLIRFFEKDEKISLILPYYDEVPTNLPIKTFYLQCLEILMVLEKLRIVHLDFRLENLRFHNSKVILIDFGNAFLMNDLNLISSDRYPPRFIRAPEFSEQHYSLIDNRVDVWSLGILIFYRTYDYYPNLNYFSDLSQIDEDLKEDVKEILTLNRPFASDLGKKYGLQEADVKLTLPQRKKIEVEESKLFINNDYSSIEIKNNKEDILRSLSLTENIKGTVALYSKFDYLNDEEMKNFELIGQQLYSRDY